MSTLSKQWGPTIREKQAKYPPKAMDFNRLQDSDGFWNLTVGDAQRLNAIRLAIKPKTDMGDLLFPEHGRNRLGGRTAGMSTLKKQWGPVIRGAASKDKFSIIVDHWGLTSTEDSSEEGTIGGPHDIQITRKDGREFPDLKSFFQAMTKLGAPNDLSAWSVFRGHPGLLKCEWMGDVKGKPFSDRDFTAWEAGQIKGFSWIMDVWVRFVREYVPATKEMSQVLRLPEQ